MKDVEAAASSCSRPSGKRHVAEPGRAVAAGRPGMTDSRVHRGWHCCIRRRPSAAVSESMRKSCVSPSRKFDVCPSGADRKRVAQDPGSQVFIRCGWVRQGGRNGYRDWNKKTLDPVFVAPTRHLLTPMLPVRWQSLKCHRDR